MINIKRLKMASRKKVNRVKKHVQAGAMKPGTIRYFLFYSFTIIAFYLGIEGWIIILLNNITKL